MDFCREFVDPVVYCGTECNYGKDKGTCATKERAEGIVEEEAVECVFFCGLF
jgi:hypothetical protein